MRGVDQQVALLRLNGRRNPKAQGGARFEPVQPNGLRVAFVRSPCGQQAQITLGILESRGSGHLQADEGLPDRRYAVGVAPFFKLGQGSALRGVDDR